MSNSVSEYMSVDKFNDGVKKWSTSTAKRLRSNLKSLTKNENKDWKGRKERKLDKSVSARPRKRKGISYGVKFSFERHGVFLHYGVGRGYVKTGNNVSKVSHSNTKSIKTSSVSRHPVDWFDKELKTEIPTLADVAQEFYGDQAMKNILNHSKKSFIEKK